jgi:hypothetical protein
MILYVSIMACDIFRFSFCWWISGCGKILVKLKGPGRKLFPPSSPLLFY